jgi:RNA polymerase sigma-70 factor (ECF subfamily)
MVSSPSSGAALTLGSETSSSLTTGDIMTMYRTHAAYVRRLLLRLGVGEADVDDLLQDVFVVALRRQSDFERRSTDRTWLCGIAVRLAVAHGRRRRVREFFRLSRAFVEEPLADERENPVRLLEQAQARRDVQLILERLSPQKRAVLVLYEVEQLSGEEIAEIVGCPLKTVWSRLFYARRDFTAALQRRGMLETGAP